MFEIPVLPFLVFLEFLAFSPCEEFLVFLSVFPFFSRDFRGSVGIKNPCFFGGFSLSFSQKTRKGRTGMVLSETVFNLFLKDGPGTELEPEAGTVGTVFQGLQEEPAGTVGTVFSGTET